VQTTPGPGVMRRATTTALALLAGMLAGSLAFEADAFAQPAPVSSDWKTLRTPHLTGVGAASAGDLQRLGRDRASAARPPMSSTRTISGLPTLSTSC
jgi:hypothetical protein